MKNSQYICVDFDGTCTTHEFPRIGQDIGAVPVLKRLVEAGHLLILFTMRSDKHDNTDYSTEVPQVHNGNFLTDAVNWFVDNGIPLYGIQINPTQSSWTNSKKAYGHLYLDDAAIGCPLILDKHSRPYVDWQAVETWLEKEGYLPPRYVDAPPPWTESK